MRLLVISCSLNPESRSRELARVAVEKLNTLGADAELFDLTTINLPICDGDSAYEDPAVPVASGKIAAASGILVAVPIYNYDVNSAAKNLLELTGSAWRGKVVGFIAAAGGHGSYMSVLSFANSLMLDYRCFILPRYVYVPDAHAEDKTFGTAAIAARIDELAMELIRVTRALMTSP